MKATTFLAALSLAASGRAQEQINSDSVGGKQGVQHGTGQACICRTADCTGLEPTATNGCKAGETENIWHEANQQCPEGVSYCPCETSDGLYVDAQTEDACLRRSQGLSDAQVAKMVENGLDPAKHECGCCHCNSIAGGRTSVTKLCDEGHVDAWDPEVHSCDSSFWIVVAVAVVLIGGGATGVYLTKKKKAQMADQEMQDKSTLDGWKKENTSDGDEE